jgi:hypothetical protein
MGARVRRGPTGRQRQAGRQAAGSGRTSWLSTAIVPPMRWHRRREIVRPRPVPPTWRVVGGVDLMEGVEDALGLGGVMPMPVSRTVKRMRSPWTRGLEGDRAALG